MSLNRIPVNKWFGYSRRERRSASLLLVIILIIIAVRYIVPEKNIGIENIENGSTHIDSISAIVEAGNQTNNMPFVFDPNSASYDTLIKYGFASKEANTFKSYRSSGGKLRKPSDIKKVYRLDSIKAEKFVSYAAVSPNKSEKAKAKVLLQEKALLDINSCDSLSLQDLPGIGPVLSARIIKYRNLLGGYASVKQLKEVYGLSEETFEMIRGRLYADSLGLRKININSASYMELSDIPYLGKYEVSSILKYRKLTGRIKSIEELKENKILTQEKAEKVEPYMDFR
jgi:competence protein ComEA